MIEFFTPTVLLFLVVILGTLLGRFKVFGVSLDLSAILILAIIAGAVISYSFGEGQNSYIDSLKSDMGFLSSLGTALFVAAIGISTGYSTANGFNFKSLLFVFAGALMVCIGFGVLIVIVRLDRSTDISILCGVLCGALTSTPGLSVVCESDNISSVAATLGYGYAYVFGVLFVVVFVQLLSRGIKKENLSNEYSEQGRTEGEKLISVIAVFIAAAVGTMLGKFTIPKVKFSLGTSGGILCVGILAGVIMKRFHKKAAINHDVISVIRSLGLIFFFVGSGVPAGMSMKGYFDVKWILYGFLITAIPVLICFFVCRLTSFLGIKENMCIIAGGMTSTPAIGVLLDKHKSLPIHIYSLTYFGALVSMIFGARLLTYFYFL